MAGPMPISHAEILSFCQLHGMRLEPWELRLAKQLDLAFLKYMHSKAATAAK
jgi:hypothetical protein